MKPVPKITLNPVKSSQIAHIGHDPATNTLAIQFHGGERTGGGGSIYHYAGVSAQQFADFSKAESIGKHFGQHIRGKFEHTKITAVKPESQKATYE